MRDPDDRSGDRLAWLAPLAVAVIWGVNVPVMKAALASMDAFAFNAARLTLSTIALGVGERLTRRADTAAPIPWRTVFELAVLTGAGYQVLFITGIDRTSAGHVGILIATGPLWTALLAVALRVERVDARAWRGLAVAFVGTACVVFTGGGGEATLVGNALVLAAMITWAAGTVRSRAVLQYFPAGRLAYLVSLVSLPAYWLMALPGLSSLGAAWTAPALLGAIVYSGVLSTGVAYVLWNASVRQLGPARTAAFANLVPLVALVVAWAMLAERPGLLQLGGGVLIVLGLTSWRRRDSAGQVAADARSKA